MDELDEVPDGCIVIFSAHGVPQSVRKEADAARLSKEFGDRFTPLLFDVTDEAAVDKQVPVHRHGRQHDDVVEAIAIDITNCQSMQGVFKGRALPIAPAKTACFI